MKVFIAYGFRDRDRWVREHVVPLIQAFNGEVVTGEGLGGQQITEAVQGRIRECDGLIGFLTARDEAGSADETHIWVAQELAVAVTAGLKVLEVRETGLTNQGGLLGDREHLVYDPADEAGCLVAIAKVLGDWSRGLTMRVLLLPDDVVRKIAPLINRTGFRCTYRIAANGRESDERPASLIRRPGGLELTANGIPATSLISVRVEGGGIRYTSPYVDADALTVMLEPED
jgi:hypothetical protein